MMRLILGTVLIVMMRLILGTVLIVISSLSLWSQTDGVETKITVNGRVYDALITPEGDTLILTTLDDANVTTTRSFTNDAEYQKYLKEKNYAQIVLPYAKKAIIIYRELEYASKFLSSRERKKKIKELDERFTVEFEDKLKGLTKLQGKILVKIIERETKKPMYDIIKEVKGGFKAFYWNTFSKLYDYDLKEGYQEGKYPIFDAVIADINVSHNIDNDSSLQYIKLNRKN
jgi:hypothetical protein